MMPASRPLRSLRLRGQKACESRLWEAGKWLKRRVESTLPCTLSLRRKCQLQITASTAGRPVAAGSPEPTLITDEPGEEAALATP